MAATSVGDRHNVQEPDLGGSTQGPAEVIVSIAVIRDDTLLQRQYHMVEPCHRAEILLQDRCDVATLGLDERVLAESRAAT